MIWLLPPPLVGIAIACAALMPTLLVALRWGPSRLRSPGNRFKITIMFAWVIWVSAGTTIYAANNGTLLIDWLAGTTAMLAATLTLYVVWSMLAWGFSVSLLMTLRAAGRPLDLDEWIKEYTHGCSIKKVCLDRLRLLTGISIVNQHGELFDTRSKSARIFVALYSVGRTIFGLGQ